MYFYAIYKEHLAFNHHGFLDIYSVLFSSIGLLHTLIVTMSNKYVAATTRPTIGIKEKKNQSYVGYWRQVSATLTSHDWLR